MATDGYPHRAPEVQSEQRCGVTPELVASRGGIGGFPHLQAKGKKNFQEVRKRREREREGALAQDREHEIGQKNTRSGCRETSGQKQTIERT